ncbi:hypothetical protein ACKWTF_008684 [Chironomus riparius]
MLSRILAILRSTECAKCIGWLKFISSIVITFFLVLVLIFFSSIAETIKKNINSSSNTKFYMLLALFMIFLIAYAACSFVLIIGTINHDRLKVSIFVAADVIFTVVLIYGFIKLFPSTFFIILLLLQLISLYSVIELLRSLFQEYNRRKEIENERKRVEQAKESFQNEIKQYQARIQIEDEQQETRNGE